MASPVSANASSSSSSANAAALLQLHDYLTYVDPPHFLKCPICTDVMKSPVSLSCGHSFCAGCCQRTLERKKECPCCRAEVLHAPHPNIALCQALDEQHVFCRFGPRTGEFPAGQPVFELDPSQGCMQQVKRSHLQTHEKECPHRWVPCGLLDTCTDERCRVLCRARELAQHQKQCKFRLVACTNDGCDEQVSLRSLEKHKQHCLFELVQCPNKGCTEQRLCKAMPQHAAQCPFRVVTCMFANIGCGEKGNVAAMDEHMRVAVNEHLMLMAQALASAQQKVLSERRVLCPKKRFKCVVHDFDRLAKKTVIDIDLDLSWKLKIWPNGEDKRHRGYVSIRLFSREAAAEFRVEGPYTLRIVNQLDASKSIVKITEASSREWADSVRGWGFPAFAKVDDVVNPAVGFLKDGKLVVDVEVVVQSVVEIVEYSEPE